jgi:hypothetical protein
MTRSLLSAGLGLCVGLLLVSGTPAPAPAQPPGPPPPAPGKGSGDAELVQKVKDAIDRGVKYLRKTQSREGDWEAFVLNVIGGQKGGPTALAALALLNAGLTRDDPTVALALKYLRGLGQERTYVVALQTMVFAEARDPADLPAIARNVKWLRDKAIYKDGKLTGWSYPMNAIADNSNTQYAVLGLYAAKTAGVKIDDEFWKQIQEFYKTTQRPDPRTTKAGFWNYANIGRMEASFTMTVGGACGLLIANMGLDKSPQELNETTGVAAKCGIYPDNDEFAKAMYWIGDQFNFMEGKSYYYNFYGLERLGRLSDQRFIGTHDWYRAGCKILVGSQEPDGSFEVRGGDNKYIDSKWPVITTSFAMLFLSKGRTPVLVSKFAWGNARPDKTEKGKNLVLVELDADRNPTTVLGWNRKHNDCRNMVEFASREIFEGAPLSWQVYDPRLLDLTDDTLIDEEVGNLLQSPLVYLNGHGKIPFLTEKPRFLSIQERILQRYVEEGGFLLAEACCGDKEFAASFEALTERLFPGSRLKPLPAEHAIWQMFPGVSPKDFPDLKYLDRGCRTVAVFSPSPLAGYWEERRFMPADARSPKTRGEKAFCLSRNIIAYATGMELPKPKLTVTKLTDRSAVSGIARSKFRPLQLKYVSDESAQPPPASDALRNLMSYLAQNAKLDVTLNSEVLTPGDDNVMKYKFMYLHGRKPVTFNQYESDRIKSNLRTGGLLLADAACSDIKSWRAFDQSFRAAMEKMWGQKLVPIPLKNGDKEDQLFKIASQAGINLKTVKCRHEKPDGSGPELEFRDYQPQLEGIKIDGRWVVVYSRYDIGCAIEGHKSADCLGHDKESALRIGSAVVLYALKRSGHEK